MSIDGRGCGRRRDPPGGAPGEPVRQALTDLIGELCTRSDEFRTRWASHDVHLRRTGVKRVHHPDVGDLELAYESLELPSDPGLVLLIFTSEVGSRTRHALDLLASLAVTPDPVALPQDLPGTSGR